MVHRQSEIKQLLRRAANSQNTTEFWADDYSEIFRPSQKRLMKRYSVPRIKRANQLHSRGFS